MPPLFGAILLQESAVKTIEVCDSHHLSTKINPFDGLASSPYNFISIAFAVSSERPSQWRPVNLVRGEIQQP